MSCPWILRASLNVPRKLLEQNSLKFFGEFKISRILELFRILSYRNPSVTAFGCDEIPISSLFPISDLFFLSPIFIEH